MRQNYIGKTLVLMGLNMLGMGLLPSNSASAQNVKTSTATANSCPLDTVAPKKPEPFIVPFKNKTTGETTQVDFTDYMDAVNKTGLKLGPISVHKDEQGAKFIDVEWTGYNTKDRATLKAVDTWPMPKDSLAVLDQDDPNMTRDIEYLNGWGKCYLRGNMTSMYGDKRKYSWSVTLPTGEDGNLSDNEDGFVHVYNDLMNGEDKIKRIYKGLRDEVEILRKKSLPSHSLGALRL